MVGEGRDAALFSSRTRVGLKVQDGCDNACTYCIVHVARGRATSVPASAIVERACDLARSGVREVVLSGINIGSYDFEGLRLAGLLERLLEATSDLHAPDERPLRFRVSSIEPADIDDDFVELLARSEGRVCRHLHVPLQSGSSKVLREMARPYDAQDFAELVEYMRACVPSLALTTDVIVGFPARPTTISRKPAIWRVAAGSPRSTSFPTPGARALLLLNGATKSIPPCALSGRGF